MYTEKVMDHFEHPRNVGEIENASGVGTVGNAKCGDIMRIYHMAILLTSVKWSIPLFPSVCHNMLYTYRSSSH